MGRKEAKGIGIKQGDLVAILFCILCLAAPSQESACNGLSVRLFSVITITLCALLSGMSSDHFLWGSSMLPIDRIKFQKAEGERTYHV